MESHGWWGGVSGSSCPERPVFKVRPCRPECGDFIPLHGCLPSAVRMPHTPSVLPPADGRLDGVHFLAVVSSAAMSGHARVFYRRTFPALLDVCLVLELLGRLQLRLIV